MLKRSASEGPDDQLTEQLQTSSLQTQRHKQCPQTDPSGCCFICAAQESSQWRTLLAGGPHICNPCGLLLARVMRRDEENGQQCRALHGGSSQQRRNPRLRWDEVSSEKRQALITALREGVADRDRREASRQALEAAAQARRIQPGFPSPQYTAPLVAASTVHSSRSAPVLPAVMMGADAGPDLLPPRIPAVVQMSASAVPAMSTSVTTGSQPPHSRSQSPPGSSPPMYAPSMSTCTPSAAPGKQGLPAQLTKGDGPGTPTRRASAQSSSTAIGGAHPALSATQNLYVEQARTEGSRLLGLLRQKMGRSSGGSGEAQHTDMEAAEVLLMMQGGREDTGAASMSPAQQEQQQEPEPAYGLHHLQTGSAAPPLPAINVQHVSATAQHELHTHDHGAIAFVSVTATQPPGAKPAATVGAAATAGGGHPPSVPAEDIQARLKALQGPLPAAPSQPVLFALPAAPHTHAPPFAQVPFHQAMHLPHLFAPPPPAELSAPPPAAAPMVSTFGNAIPATVPASRSHPSLPSILLADALLAELSPTIPQLAALPQLDCCSAISRWLGARGLQCSTDPQHAWVADMVMLAVARDIALFKHRLHQQQQLLQGPDGARLLHT